VIVQQNAGATRPASVWRRRGGIEMNAISQLPHRSEVNRRAAAFSAWAISLVFAGLAATSFAVDQSVMTSAYLGEEQTGLQSLWSDDCLGQLQPFRLIKSLVGRIDDRR
jgi:hypothetical protein